VTQVRQDFPQDFKQLETAAAAAPQNEWARLFAGTMSTIRERDGDLVLKAPAADLAALIEADKQFLSDADTSNPELCRALIAGQPFTTASPTLRADFGLRASRLLTAIKDGRDQPITARRANPDDYRAFAAKARTAGANMTQWADLAPQRLSAAPATDVCEGMISIEQAALSQNDDLADRVNADMAAIMARQWPN
jgi:hypothetical protein